MVYLRINQMVDAKEQTCCNGSFSAAAGLVTVDIIESPADDTLVVAYRGSINKSAAFCLVARQRFCLYPYFCIYAYRFDVAWRQ